MAKRVFRPKQSVGKYRIEKLLARGGFAEVYRALDTIEGVRVALKVPYEHLVDRELLEGFRSEVRLTARLDHPNILPIKNATFVDSHFVIATPLGEKALSDRLQHRLSFQAALNYAEQLLSGLAFAHEKRVLHCDIKPDNLILFESNRLRLADFGIAKVALRTVAGSGSGTLGYIAPEQAMGRPSFRSDVFSAGLILYRMFSGKLPEWPFEQPLPGYARLQERLHPELLAFIERAISLEAKRRFATADEMARVFARVKPKALRHHRGVVARRKPRTAPKEDWSEVRWRQFRRRYGGLLKMPGECRSCSGPLAEAMLHCPWCGEDHEKFRGRTCKRRCPRCRRGLKADWRFCPWCYGPSLPDASTREYDDKRYSARCDGAHCSRRQLMPFMRYCPWCRRKVRKRWMIPGSRKRCRRCGHGVATEYWDFCPWCGDGF